jgi:hypothetical protein
LAWRWVNAKIDKKSIALMKHIAHVFKEDMEDYNLSMFTHAMDFFKELAHFKKPVLKLFLQASRAIFPQRIW